MLSSLALNQPRPTANSRPSDALLERLRQLHPKLIDLSLDRMERLLARLGHPERALPPVVHVAGTNGKGSVIAYLRAMLEAAGRRVHVYTSPHLIHFHERIRLDGRLIDDAELTALLAECELANGANPITEFEVTTAAALLAFARHPADVLLLETGLGGRLDATNVVERPRLAVITPVSIDHVQFLGDSLAKIAFEKAGILKAGVPAVIGAQGPEALQAIEQRARVLGAPLRRAGFEWHAGPADDGFRFINGTGTALCPAPVLPGSHQIVNAACAVAAAHELSEFGLDKDAIAEGLRCAVWPGRLQQLTSGSLADLVPPDWELWLDGGHNEAAGRALADTLEAWSERPAHVIYGMMNSKAIDDFLRPIAARATSLQAVTIPGELNALGAQEAAEAAERLGAKAAPRCDVSEAIRHAVSTSQQTVTQSSRLLICGSLYLAGAVLAQNNPAA